MWRSMRTEALDNECKTNALSDNSFDLVEIAESMEVTE